MSLRAQEDRGLLRASVSSYAVSDLQFQLLGLDSRGSPAPGAFGSHLVAENICSSWESTEQSGGSLGCPGMQGGRDTSRKH